MNKKKVTSLVVVIALLMMAVMPITALAASASASVSASKTTAAPGETVTITVDISTSGALASVGCRGNMGGLSLSSSSSSGFNGLGTTNGSNFIAAPIGSTITSGGKITYTVTIPSDAQEDSVYTASFRLEAVDEASSYVLDTTKSVDITVAGGSGSGSDDNSGSGDNTGSGDNSGTGNVPPTSNPTPVPSGSNAFHVGAEASKTNVSAGDSIIIKASLSVSEGSYQAFGMKFSSSDGLEVGTPSATGLSPLGLNVSTSGFAATSLSGSTTTGSGTVSIPVRIPSAAKKGDTFTFTISSIEGVTAAGTQQTKSSITITLKVGSGSSSGSGSGSGSSSGSGSGSGSSSGNNSTAPVVTPVPAKAPSIRTTLVGAMSGLAAGETVSYQVRYQVIEGEATGFSGALSYDTTLMELSAISFDMPEEWTGSSDGTSFTIMKTGYADTPLKVGDEVAVNLTFKLKADTSSAVLLTLSNMLVTDTQWTQHALNDINAIASSSAPSFTAAVTPVGDVEPGAYVDLSIDFTPVNGAFRGFLGMLEYDSQKLSFVSAEAPEGWTVISQGNQIGMASEEGIIFMNETVRLNLRFFVSSSSVMRGDTVPLKLTSIRGQGIGSLQSTDKYQVSAPDLSADLTIVSTLPSFTAVAAPEDRRALPGSTVKYTMDITSVSGHMAGFAMDYSFTDGLTLVNVLNDRGWIMSYENNKLKVYTNGMNAIKAGEKLTIEFYLNLSAATEYGSVATFETGTITGASHLGETVTHDPVKASILAQSAFVNQKTTKYDFTSSVSAGVNGLNELVVDEKNYGALITDKEGISAAYNVCMSNIGNKDGVLAIDVLSDEGKYAFRQLALTYKQLTNLNKAGVDFLALVMDGGMVMVNLDVILSSSTKRDLKEADLDTDDAKLIMSIAPVTEDTSSLSERQLLEAKRTVTNAYRINAYLDDGSMQMDMSEIAGCSFVVFSMEDIYLTDTVEKASALRVLGLDATLLVELREARLLSELVNNDNVRRSIVGVYKNEGIYAAALK